METDLQPPPSETTAQAEVTLDAVASERLIAMLDPAVLGTVNVELTASLGRGTLTMHKLASLASGDVIALDTPLNGTVDLALNGTLVARGEIVAVGDQFGVRVTDILARKQ
ncbi:MAG: FliM/FliN family flagellar motor switch protein [Sphingomonadales bacterium]|nr:FliM/FliN family flagellar motor switch protein [Sphingomonadales bacterium]